MRKLYLLLQGLLLCAGSILAQKTITGKVTDEKGTSIPNVSVVAKGTSSGTVTSTDGMYRLTVASNATTLVFSSVDFASLEVPIGNSPIVNTTLKGKDATLGEVVVTGYTTRKRTEFTGATTSVGAKDIDQLPLGSFEQMLQGQAPGVYIASGSGQPGSTARVNIRGVGSFGNVNPLYILDGIPIEDGVFRTLNPNDFENVEILKDAASAGQYGSRGANGVVVITSKKGRAGRISSAVRASTGFAQRPQQLNLEMMNTPQRLQYEEQYIGPALFANPTGLTGYPGWDYSPNNPRYQTLSAAQRATEAGRLDSIRAIDTYWPDLMSRNGKFSQQEINASGGTNGLTFYTSLSHYKQEGILIRSELERYTFRNNLDFKKDRLTISLRSTAGFSQLNGVESEAGVALANPIAAAYLELPYRRLFLPNGKVNTSSSSIGPNAYDRAYTTTSLTNQFKGNLSITAQFDIWNGIAFRTTNGVDWRNNNSSRFIDPNSYAGTLSNATTVANGGSGIGQGSYNEGNSENLQLITTTGFVFSKVFADKHSVNANVMIEAIRNRGRSNSFTGYGINPRLLNTPAGITAGTTTNNYIPVVSGGRSLNGLFSSFALVDYTYDSRFTISGTVRQDADSRLPEKNRQNAYWTAGGSWNIIRENFMTNQNIFTELRVRGSYGELANINGLGSDFGYISTYGAGSYAGISGIVPSSPGNQDYKLETQLISNIGIDLAFWKGRARITADFFKKTSNELFLNQQLSRTAGFTSLRINAGSMVNQGVEAQIFVDVVKVRDLLITIGVNGAPLKNRITSLGQIDEIAAGTGISRVGLPFGTHYVVGYLGVDPQTGAPIYSDKDGKPTPTYLATNSRADFGTYLPKFTGGASLDVAWKGFSLSTLFHTAQGVKRFNNESYFYETTNANIAYNKSTVLFNSWLKPGDITDYQRISSVREFSSKDIRDASFVRFRNLMVGYTYNLKNQKYIRSVRIWGMGENLYTWTKWTGFDPEESNNIATYEFPNPKTYTFGVDFNF